MRFQPMKFFRPTRSWSHVPDLLFMDLKHTSSNYFGPTSPHLPALELPSPPSCPLWLIWSGIVSYSLLKLLRDSTQSPKPDPYSKGCRRIPNHGPILHTLAYSKSISLGLQIAQRRSYSYTLSPKVGILNVLGAIRYRDSTQYPNIPDHIKETSLRGS